MTYQQNNTIRFTANFKDWDNVDVDPALIKFILYDSRYNKLDEYSIGQANKLSVGNYYFDFVANDVGNFVYEWYSEIGGTPSVKRARFSVIIM